uniref:uncharacterized protein LOC100184710 n=1 Tax=Ciona intestinalis TaxID=7719 RepID=UPI000EF47B82|nr:uncharacterized protein LOC100184710 [Ciona intestinalis]|eukprot:XP_002131757.3 uncharacterized protein LOC100184710 [Ciona intestinalis]
MDQIKEDLQNLNVSHQQLNSSLGLQAYNMKRVIYRSATVIISAFGRLNSLTESSCFDVINKLEKNGNSDTKVAHQLRFMVAVACEVRAKVYHAKGQQVDVFAGESAGINLTSSLSGIVGKHSLVSFMEAVLALQEILKFLFLGKELDMPRNVRQMLRKLDALFCLDLRQDLICQIKKMMTTIPWDDSSVPVCMIVISYAFICEDYDLVLDLCAKTYRLNLTEDEKVLVKVHELKCIVARSYIEETKSYDCTNCEVDPLIHELDGLIEAFEQTIKTQNCSGETQQPDLLIPILRVHGCLEQYARNLVKLRRHQHASKVYANSDRYQAISDEIGISRSDLTTLNPIVLCNSADTLFREGKYKEAFLQLHEAKRLLHPCKTKTVKHVQLYDTYASCFYHVGQYYESFICFFESMRIANKLNIPTPIMKQDMKKVIQLIIPKT